MDTGLFDLLNKLSFQTLSPNTNQPSLIFYFEGGREETRERGMEGVAGGIKRVQLGWKLSLPLKSTPFIR